MYKYYHRPDNIVIADLAIGLPLIDTVDERYKRFLPAVNTRLELYHPCGYLMEEDKRHEELELPKTVLSIYMDKNLDFAEWVEFWHQLPIRISYSYIY